MSNLDPREKADAAFRESRRIFDRAYVEADSLLDRGQGRAFRLLWFFLPDTSVAKDVRFQAVFASKFLSDAGQQALAYGALIAVVRNGGSAFDAALVGASALVPPALLGLYGGAVADALPKRLALAGVYNLQALFCFGLVRQLTFIDAVNPLRLLTLAGLHLNQRLRTAALLALPVGFGLSLTTTAVQTFINRRVPLSHQGRTFALQSALKNGTAIIPLLSLAGAAGLVGVEAVLLASPVLLLAIALGLIQLSRHFGGSAPRGTLGVLSSFWERSA